MFFTATRIFLNARQEKEYRSKRKSTPIFLGDDIIVNMEIPKESTKTS